MSDSEMSDEEISDEEISDEEISDEEISDEVVKAEQEFTIRHTFEKPLEMKQDEVISGNVENHFGIPWLVFSSIFKKYYHFITFLFYYNSYSHIESLHPFLPKYGKVLTIFKLNIKVFLIPELYLNVMYQ